ncbi:hypothetical protein BH09VER1_BH09VER1_06950 [soil metagenome]
MATHPADIGGAEIDKCDPRALSERIKYLVKHEIPFSEHEEMLEEVLRRQPGYDWRVYENFASLLREYRRELDAGSIQAAEKRDAVTNFSL